MKKSTALTLYSQVILLLLTLGCTRAPESIRTENSPQLRAIDDVFGDPGPVGGAGHCECFRLNPDHLDVVIGTCSLREPVSLPRANLTSSQCTAENEASGLVTITEHGSETIPNAMTTTYNSSISYQCLSDLNENGEKYWSWKVLGSEISASVTALTEDRDEMTESCKNNNEYGYLYGTDILSVLETKHDQKLERTVAEAAPSVNKWVVRFRDWRNWDYHTPIGPITTGKSAYESHHTRTSVVNSIYTCEGREYRDDPYLEASYYIGVRNPLAPTEIHEHGSFRLYGDSSGEGERHTINGRTTLTNNGDLRDARSLAKKCVTHPF